MKKRKNVTRKVLGAVLGAVTGFVGGFFGGGGGMVAVPVLQSVLKIETKKSHATTMLIILPMSIFAALTYFFKGVFELKSTLICGGGVIAGGILGAFLLKKLNSEVIQLIFALIMIGAGLKLIF